MAFLVILALAILQALTEFLPVSSSGHLMALTELFGSNTSPQTREAFFVLLHSASLLAVVVVLWKDIVAIVRSPKRWRWALAVLIACLPAGILGIALKVSGRAELLFDSLWVVAVGWLLTTVFLLASKQTRERRWSITDPGPLPVRALVLIGLAQALAVVPGVSRSGSTIATALLLGLQREESFKFSFLAALPLIAGAQLLELKNASALGTVATWTTLAAAFAVCFAVSIIALVVLRRVVTRDRLHWFAPYCLLAALATLGWLVFRPT